MSADLVLVDSSDDVLTLTLNQPERRNALSRAMLGRLSQAVREAGDSDPRVVVLRANGPVFSSGHDLKELAKSGQAEREQIFAACTHVMEGIRTLSVPVIAEVGGLATAAGCQLAASCDLVIASIRASFATPGVNIGLFCSTPAVPLCRSIPPRKALEMLLTGDAISAEEAERLGLVNRVVEPDQLETETRRWAQRLAARPADVIALGKRIYYQQLTMEMSDAYLVAQAAMVQNATFANAREGMQAFLEKREPMWNGCAVAR